MPRLNFNVGTGPNSGNGDPLRNAFEKVELNFGELYSHANSIDNPHNVTVQQIGAQPLNSNLTSISSLSATGLASHLGSNVWAIRQIGVQAGASIPDRDAADLRYLTLTGGTLTGALTLHSDPTLDMQPATKRYVDTLIQGLNPKNAVRVATNGPVTLSGLQVIDGVNLAVDNRILVKNQINQAENGIYLVKSGSWIRSLDMNDWSEVPSSYTFVSEGSQGGSTGWVVTSSTLSGTIGTTPIVWTQFSGQGTYTASNGIIRSVVDFQLTGQASALHNLNTSGLIVRTGLGTVTSRTIVAPPAGISVTNGDGIAGNPTLALTNDLAALEAISTTGFARRTGIDTWSASALTNSEITTALGYTPWHPGNDGAGSGLDADLLDGQNGTFYQNASNLNSGTIPFDRLPALTGDVSLPLGGNVLTLATVNSNVGAFGNATHVATFTVNGKGLTTAAGTALITPAWSSVTGKPTTLAGYQITAADVLSALLTVDGTGSGLDADLLDGQTGTFYQNATNINAGTLAAARLPAFSGDASSVAGNSSLTLATVNANVGTFGNATHVSSVTVNGKGLTTAANAVLITPAWSSITNKPDSLDEFGFTDSYDFFSEIAVNDPISSLFAPNAIDFVSGLSRWNNYYANSTSLITYSRVDTNATSTSFTSSGAIVTFSSNVPRITNKGILVEETRTNLFPRYSPTVAQLSLSGNAADTSEPANPPISGRNWFTLTNTSGTAFAYQNATPLANTSYVVQFLVETPDGSPPVGSQITTTGDFTLNLGGTTGTFVAWSYERLTGNVWRVIGIATSQGSPNANTGIIRYTTQNTRVLKFSGFDIQAGTYATSPIITSGSSGTRGVENITLNVEDVISSSLPYTICIEAEKVINTPNGTLFEGEGITGSTFAYSGNGLNARLINRNGSVRTDNQNRAIAQKEVFRMALTSSGRLSVKGITELSTSVPSQINWGTTACIGHRGQSPTFHFNGYFRELSVYPYVLSQSQLNDITRYDDSILLNFSSYVAESSSLFNLPGWSFSRTDSNCVATAFNVNGSAVRFSSGIPRITDRGILVEEARSNILIFSQQFEDANWTKNATVVTANQALGPDGTMTADLLVDTVSNTEHNTTQTPAISAATTYTQTWVVKPLNHRYVGIGWFSAFNPVGFPARSAIFDLQNGTVSTPPTGEIGATASITPLINGWFLLRITAPSGASATQGTSVLRLVSPDGTSLSYAGTGTGVYIWNAQLEVGAFPTSPILTAGSVGSRGADLPNFATTFPVEGTIVIDYEGPPAGNTTQRAYGWNIDDVGNDRLTFRVNDIANINMPIAVVGDGTTTTNLSFALATVPGAITKVGLTYSALSARAAFTQNGVLTSVTRQMAVSGLSGGVMGIGQSQSGGNSCNTYIRSIRIISRVLSDAELQAITIP